MITLHPRVRPIRPRHLVPSVVVVVLAITAPTFAEPDECASTDGPQFECYLRRTASH